MVDSDPGSLGSFPTKSYEGHSISNVKIMKEFSFHQIPLSFETVLPLRHVWKSGSTCDLISLLGNELRVVCLMYMWRAKSMNM